MIKFVYAYTLLFYTKNYIIRYEQYYVIEKTKWNQISIH